MVFRRVFAAVLLGCMLSCNAGFDDEFHVNSGFTGTSDHVLTVGIVCDELAQAIEDAKDVLYQTLHIDFSCPPNPTPPPPPTLPPTLPPPPPPPTTPPPQPPTTPPPPPPTTPPPPPPTTPPPPPPTTPPPPPPTTPPPPPPTTQPPPPPTTPPPPPPTTPPPPPPTTPPPPPPTIIDSSFSELSSFLSNGPISEASDHGDNFVRDGNECFTRPDAADYRGYVSVTASGYTCQYWESEGVDPAYRDKFGGDANFCRNMASPLADGEKRLTAWCYTTDPQVSWEYCDVGEFQDECSSRDPQVEPDVGTYICDGTNPECYEDRFGADYLGHVSVTESGRTCQMWNIDYPHNRKNKYKPASDSLRFGDHNYCRNIGYKKDGIQLSNRRRPWCYTTDPDVVWEYCDVGLPCDVCEGRDFDEDADVLYTGSYPECYLRNDASDYRGFVNYTRSGRPCQRWLEQLPHPVAKGNVMLFGHHDNYCRIRRKAYRTGKKPFCFTTDPEVEWEYCEVGDPHEVCLNEHLKPVAPYVGHRPECYTEKDGQDYRGFVSTTVSGYTCEYWRDRVNNKKYSKAFKDEANYCRTLGIEAGPGFGKPWCFIEGHPTLDWEYCDVGPRHRTCIDVVN